MSLQYDSFTGFDFLTATQFSSAPVSDGGPGGVDIERRFKGTVASMGTGWNGIGQAAVGPAFSRIFTPGFDTFGISFHFKVSSLAAAQGLLWFGVNQGEGFQPWQCVLGINTNGVLFFQGAEGTIWFAPPPDPAVIAVDTWYTLEFLYEPHLTSGAFQVRLDGVKLTKLDRSGIQTAAWSDNIDVVRFSNPNLTMDDLVIRAGEGGFIDSDAISDQFGSPQVSTLTPARDGSLDGWDNDVTSIDETLGDTSDYIESGPTGDRQTWLSTAVAPTASELLAVSSSVLAQYDVTKAGVQQFIIRNGVEKFGSVVEPPGDPNWAYDAQLWLTPPGSASLSASKTWSKSDLYGLELGVVAPLDTAQLNPTNTVRVAHAVIEAAHKVQAQLALPVVVTGNTNQSLMVPNSHQSLQRDQSHHFAHLYRIKRYDDVILRFTDHNHPILVPASVGIDSADAWYNTLGGLSASAAESSVGMNTSNAEVVGILSDDSITNEDMRQGRYRDAQIDEYMIDWRYPWAGWFAWRRFWITDTSFNGLVWTTNLAGLGRFLREPIGRSFTKRCQWSLGDSRCKAVISATPRTQTGTVTAVYNDKKFDLSLAPSGQQATSFYHLGHIDWLTGANVGLVPFDIQNNEGDTFWTFVKMPTIPEIGDTCTVVVGCAKSFSNDCVGIYNNGVNFGGFPDIPGPNKFLQTPSAKA